jgi:hypothetical protein
VCTVAGFYRYAVEEELLDHSPADHVRRPRLDYESHAVGLDRNELGALLVAARLGPPAEHALISLLCPERTAGIRGHQRGHRGPGHRAGPPDPGGHAERGQGRDDPAGAADRAGDRPGHRRAPTARSSSRLTGGGWTGTAPGGSSAFLTCPDTTWVPASEAA